MTFAPQTLKDLAAYWISEGGVNLGIVGDVAHVDRGTSYHLGKDQLLPGAYSAETPRDKAGLSNAASAIDLGKLDGSYGQLRAFSDWLARRCVKNDAGTRDVREVIYSPDGARVLGFKDGIDFLIPNYGDSSHLTHTHISFYRDSEFRDKTALFTPYFLPDTGTEDPMPDLNYGAERWLLDGTTPVTSIGAPRLADGSSDPAIRYCLTTGKGGTPQYVAPIDRSRLTPVGNALSDEFWAALTSYKLPSGDEKHPVEISLDGRIVYSGAI